LQIATEQSLGIVSDATSVLNAIAAANVAQTHADATDARASAVAASIAADKAGYTTVATITDRDTFYATEANRGKLVYVNNNGGSATDPANGVYEYVGGTVRFAQSFYARVASVVQPLVNEAKASAMLASQKATSATASAQTAAAVDQSVRDNIAKIDTASALQLQAVSRQLLAAIGPSQRSEGRQAYLGEAGRQGTFVWRAADQSALVTADPDQGLYIAPASQPDGSAGCWARVVVGMIYRAEWWGITDGFIDSVQMMPTKVGNGVIDPSYPQSRTFQYMLKLLPEGAFLFITGGTFTVAQLLESTKPIHIVGIEGKTRMTGTGLAKGQGAGIIRLNASNSTITGVEFFDMRNNFGTIPPPCIVVAGNADPARQNNPVSNIDISHCRFTNVSAGIIVYASDWQRSDAGAQNTRNVSIHNCIWDGCDYEHTNLYGVDGWSFYRNTVRMDYLNINRDYYCFRMIGAANGVIEDNVFYGPGYARSDMRCFNILDGAGPLGQGNGQPRKCANILIRNNDCYDFTLGIRTGDNSGKDIFVANNRFINRVLKSDTHRETIAFYGNGYTRPDAALVFLGNYIRGYDALYYFEFGILTQLDVTKNEFAALGRFDQGKPSTGFARCNGMDISLARLNRNLVSGPQIDGPFFSFPNCSANLRAQVLRNDLPEMLYPVGDGRRSPANGVGSVQTALNGSFFDMSSGQVPAGDNAWAAPGTYAASQRVPA
jgi:hypothetical protein